MLVCCRFEGHIECPPGISHPSFSVNHSILEAVRPRLKDFHQLLLEPPKVKKQNKKRTWFLVNPYVVSHLLIKKYNVVKYNVFSFICFVIVGFCSFLLIQQRNVMKTTWGVLDPPVGNTRLSVVRLVASLLQSNTRSINTELINLNTPGVILVSASCMPLN